MFDAEIESIEWSSETVVIAEDGTPYPLFQQDTFAAKIHFTTGQVRIVVCPSGAAQSSHDDWESAVREVATASLGLLQYRVLVLEGSINPSRAILRTS